MKHRFANKEDEKFVDELCRLSYESKEQWIGYPRVNDLNELMAEIKEYENTFEDSIIMLEKDSRIIGFTGFLYEPGDDEAFVIGPVFIKEEHTVENVTLALATLTKLSKFDDLIIGVPEENQTTNLVLKEEDWHITNEQYEMVYDSTALDNLNVENSIYSLSSSEDPDFHSVAKLFEDAFDWQNPESRLGHYLDEFGMEAGYIQEEQDVLGAVLWDDVEDTDFLRLEDVAVHPDARRKGIASDLIAHVLNTFAKTEKKEIFLAVDQDNLNAKRLYEKLGFKQTMMVRTFKYDG
ncbi:GNAT family N-acetyltransferase [Alkalibacillus almallahensis]|uniref:GNAT family N-acetyltransferase n=1 Tax=Alkalibacillus almallahensis TaxID=1379154 RepID=UPI0014217FB3|nr:GNAT family N-acetyltransferase [Alkalibacillus almallahensis]NIK12598.1 ribosomal protein S18 acetylase RimI-like enzyme [Alkalibacillus almallahensis]